MDVRSSYLTVGLSFSLRHVTDGDPILLGRHGMPGRDACNCDGGSRPRMRRPPFRNVRLNGLKPYNEARLWATSISSIHLLQLNVPVVFDPLDMFDVFLVEIREKVQRHPYVCDEELGHKPLPFTHCARAGSRVFRTRLKTVGPLGIHGQWRLNSEDEKLSLNSYGACSVINVSQNDCAERTDAHARKQIEVAMQV